MKKYLFLVSFLFALFACDKTETVQPISVSIAIELPEGFSVPANAADLSTAASYTGDIPEGYTGEIVYVVRFINLTDNSETVALAGRDGVATASLMPGIYNVIVSAGWLQGNIEFNFSGTANNVNILLGGSTESDGSIKIPLPIVASEPGTLVFKELYYVGSRTPANSTYFRDQFYELYNNGESTIYIDGLCLGTIYSQLASANQPTWEDIENAENYIFYQWLFQFPGTGKDYPLNPGESVVIAQWATNHQVEALNLSSPVNLTSAEFEAYLSTANVQTDETAINLNNLFRSNQTTMPQWLSSVFGSAWAIFFPEADFDPTKLTTQKGSSLQGIAVPISQVLDAVEAVDNDTKVLLKRIPVKLDAGATYVGATYTAQSVSRKIKETKEDGRVIYTDTNNSTTDFQLNDTPVVRRNGAKIPSWNIWAN
jgi:hypothetical protein